MKIGIKAGSSIFDSESSYGPVAQMIQGLIGNFEILFFVVSAVKGETDKTIRDIAWDFSKKLGQDYNLLLKELNDALKGTQRPYNGWFNTADIASRLVQPEMRSAENIVTQLRILGIETECFRHGQDYPLIGKDDNQYLYATPDIDESCKHAHLYQTKVVVVPGFGVRNLRGEVMCTGRGSSDLTLIQIAQLYGLNEIVFWKDTGGYWRSPSGPEEGILPEMTRKDAFLRADEKVLDRRVLEYDGLIRITGPGLLTGGTLI